MYENTRNLKKNDTCSCRDQFSPKSFIYETASVMLRPGGGGYSYILAIWVCATGKGMVFKPFTLG